MENVRGIIIVIISLAYISYTYLWNFNNGCPLNDPKKRKTLYSILQTFFLALAATQISDELRNAVLAGMVVFGLGLNKYIEIQNGVKNRDNPDLLASYASELKKERQQIYIVAAVFLAIIIVFLFLENRGH